MRKIIFISLLLLVSCKKNEEIKDVDTILMSIKNYTCDTRIERFSNKNVLVFNAKETYKYPDNYSICFDDDTNISYINNILTIHNGKTGDKKEISDYQNINKNPLFLSYFLNTYFNNRSDVSKDSSEVTIVLPDNNSYLYKATLKTNNNVPYSLTYFDKNDTPLVNIIYNKFDFESL
ncbi:MAG: hypothetical protein IJS47_01475 [Clostridia bacterium]|nr:hypothetical protein [Clostridia bacterium]